MGVRGLITTIRKRQEECVDFFDLVDLVEVARQKGGIEILVDYYAFQSFIIQKIWNGLSKDRNNEFLRLCGGEYGTIEEYITKFVQDLKSLDITLVFFVNGGQGTCTKTTRQNLDTWNEKLNKYVKKLDKIMAVCRDVTSIQALSETDDIKPVLVEIQVRHTISQLGCEIHHAIGDADYIIAKALHDRPHAYAILSNDTDFCIFKDSRFIPLELFDTCHGRKLGYRGDLPEKPSRLMTVVITTSKVMEMFEFENYGLLVELSIVAGNDFTGHFMWNGLQKELDIRVYPDVHFVHNIARWLRQCKSADKYPVFRKEMERNSLFRDAVQHSRNFYTLSDPEHVMKPPQQGDFSQLIGERIMNGTLPGNIMAMHNKFYWHRLSMEDNSRGSPCVETSLAELRGRIYRIVLPRQEYSVTEYGRSPWKPRRTTNIIASDDPDLPVIHEIHQDKTLTNIKHFHYVISHQEEPGKDVVWFDRYGRKNGFIVYILRYFLLQNWGWKLNITDKEFLALAAMAFGKPKEKEYQQIALRPTPRCASISSWFQDIYRHAYDFLAKLLYLTKEFPLPKEIFSGAAWTAFYTCTCCKDEKNYMGVNQVPMDILQKTQFEMNGIINEKQDMIRCIVEGVDFPFDDTFVGTNT